MQVLDAKIRRVCIVDDDTGGAATMSEIITDADLEPDIVELPLDDDPGKAARLLAERCDAVVCDHHLMERAGATYNGASLLGELYDLQRPTVLHTNWVDVLEAEIRRERRRVPVLISGVESDPEQILDGFRVCLGEFDGVYIATRRPWRTAVHVEECDTEANHVSLWIPEWDSRRRVRMPLDILPRSMRRADLGGTNFMASVNVRASDINDLYIDGVEVPDA